MVITTALSDHSQGTSLIRRRVVAALTVSLSVLAVAGVAIAPTAQAVNCSSASGVTYDTVSNVIKVLTAGPWTLTNIKAACGTAPLTEMSHGVWELSADLVILNGATLTLHGSGASTPGDVNTLRLRSLSDNLPAHVSSITARGARIDADTVSITSWDDRTGAPDTNPNLPAGNAATNRGRAFIRAQSFIDGAGAGQSAAMNFTHSTLSNLGYYAGESYGVSWKSTNCSHLAVDFQGCAKAPVTGGATNSTFTHNYMGAYVWGGRDMTFTGNRFENNIMYGLDTHDVTTNLLVKGNHFGTNGDHAFICAERCDRLNIISNLFEHNGMVPFSGPIPTGDVISQEVHAIMLFRGVTNTSVTGNIVRDERTGAGIALVDSAGDTVANNRIDGALYGLRLSVGASANTFTSNIVTNSIRSALLTYKGKDIPTYTPFSLGHPTRNRLTGNWLGSRGLALQVAETNGTVFSQTPGSMVGPIHIARSAGTVIKGGVRSGAALSVTGSLAERTSVNVVDPMGSLVTTIADPYSTIYVTSSSGQLYLVAGRWAYASVTRAASVLRMTLATRLTKRAVAVSPTRVRVIPTTGRVFAAARPISTGAIQVAISASTSRVGVSITSLTPLHRYAIRSSATAGAFFATTTRAGTLVFNDPGRATVYTATRM